MRAATLRRKVKRVAESSGVAAALAYAESQGLAEFARRRLMSVKRWKAKL